MEGLLQNELKQNGPHLRQIYPKIWQRRHYRFWVVIKKNFGRNV